MSKSTLSTTVNTKIISLLDKWGNKSQIVNKILSNALQTREGITELIEDTKITLEKLEKIRNRIIEREERQFDKISPKLRAELMGGTTVNENGNKVINNGVKAILEENPNKLILWTGIINKKYNVTLNPNQLLDLIRRLSNETK